MSPRATPDISPDNTPDERLFTVAEAAKDVLKCSPSKVRNLLRAGHLGYIDISEGQQRVNIRIPYSALREYIESRYVPAKAS